MRDNQRSLLSKRPLRILFLLTLFAGTALPARVLANEEAEPVPARIRATEGTVTLTAFQEQEQLPATLNLPVYAGDDIRTDEGQAEIHLPEGSLLWLAEATRVEFVDLGGAVDESRNPPILSLHVGTLAIDYRGAAEDSESDFRIDTPEASVYLLGPGRFRIDSERGTTFVTSWRGVAELAGDEGSVLVRGGQRSEVGYGSYPAQPWEVNTLRLDSFDEWCEDRAEAYLSRARYEGSREYTEELPPPVRHYATELEYYGDWRYLVEFGWVWSPRIYGAGWRPYYDGYWHWGHTGWVWVGYEPWGWAPYHYGRWHRVTSLGWIWIPGGVYSGAWVSWAVTPSYVGWCPLDYYNRPAYIHVGASRWSVRQYGGAWNFLPLNRFHERQARRHIVRSHHVPNLDGAVTTRDLPRFSPELARRRPEIAERLYRDAANSRGRLEPPRGSDRKGIPSFREQDGREEPRMDRRSGRGRVPSDATRRIQLSEPKDVAPRAPTTKIETPGVSQGARDLDRNSPRAGADPGRRSRQPTVLKEKPRKADDRDRRATPSRPRDDGRESQGRVSRPRSTPPKRRSPSAVAPQTKDPSQRVLRKIFTDRKNSREAVKKRTPSSRIKTGQPNEKSNPKATRPSRGGSSRKGGEKATRPSGKEKPRASSKSKSGRSKSSSSSRKGGSQKKQGGKKR